MDLNNIQDLLPLFILFGGMGSPSQENPSTPSDIFPMIFMMKAMENPDGNYRTTFSEQMIKAMQYEALVRQSGMTLGSGLAILLELGKIVL